MSWKKQTSSRVTSRIIIREEGLLVNLVWRPFFWRWIQPLRERVSLMCDSLNAVSPSGEPIEPVTALQVLVVTNKVLGPKS